MSVDGEELRGFPELTSFGTLFRFAVALEEAGARVSARAPGGESELTAYCAQRHCARAAQLERLRRERLNEVVLQPVSGLSREKYLAWCAPGTTTELGALLALEEASALFYEDAASVASRLLGGVERTFRRLAAENRTLAERLLGEGGG